MQSIDGFMVCFGKKYYLIRWKGYPPSVSTWEPLDNLHEVINRVLIYDYHRKKKYLL